MKIFEDSPPLLVFKARNEFLFIVGLVLCGIGASMIFYPQAFKPPQPLWLAIAIIFGGYIFLSTTPVVTITFDKSRGMVSFVSKKMFGTKTEEIPISQIKKIELLQSIARESGKARVKYRLYLSLSDGGVRELPEVFSFNPLRPQSIVHSGMGAKIGQFLNIPFEDRREPTVGETLTAIKDQIKEEIRKAKEEKSRRPME